jgi:hypothetical protein
MISADAALDGTYCELLQALQVTVAVAAGTVICCIPGKLAYFEGEHPGDRSVLHRLG